MFKHMGDFFKQYSSRNAGFVTNAIKGEEVLRGRKIKMLTDRFDHRMLVSLFFPVNDSCEFCLLDL